MNKEALRKELEDCWDASRKWQLFIRHGGNTTNAPLDGNTYITTRLAALDGLIYTPIEPLDPTLPQATSKRVDDGQEGKGLHELDLKLIRESGYIKDDEIDLSKTDFLTDEKVKIGGEIARKLMTPALALTDGEGEKVGWNKGISGVTLPDPQASDNVMLPSSALAAAKRKRDLLFDVLSSYERRIEIRAAALAFIKAYDELLEVAP